MTKEKKPLSKKVVALNTVLLVLIGGSGYWGYQVLHPKAAPVVTQTATVTRGDVAATVSATERLLAHLISVLHHLWPGHSPSST